MQKFQVGLDRTKETSNFILGLLEKIGKGTKEFQNDSTLVHDAQVKSIADFQKAYEVHCLQHFMIQYHKFGLIGHLIIEHCKQEQSRSEEEKLLANITNLVSDHMRRQRELVCLDVLSAYLGFFF